MKNKRENPKERMSIIAGMMNGNLFKIEDATNLYTSLETHPHTHYTRLQRD